MVKPQSTSPGRKIWREAKNLMGGEGTKSYIDIESSNGFENADVEASVPKTWGKGCSIAVKMSIVLLVAAAAAVCIVVGVNHHSHKNGGVESATFAPLVVSVKSMKSLCDTTLYPDVCSRTLSSPGTKNASPQKLVLISMEAAMQAVNESLSLSSHLRSMLTGGNGSMEASALDTCTEVLRDSLDQVNTSISLVADVDCSTFSTVMGDVQTYMSAALTDQDTCLSGIQEFGAGYCSGQLSGRRGKHVTALLSISLALVNKFTADFNKLDPSWHP